MNLFFLDPDAKKCAEYHCDKHVVKMILELTQMLYTAHYIHKTDMDLFPSDYYKPISNQKHPTNVWISLNIHNYTYAISIAKCLSEEYTNRYHRIHSCDKHVKWLSINFPSFKTNVDYSGSKKKVVFGVIPGFPDLTPVPLSMPEDSMICEKDSLQFQLIKSYRNYYLLHKRHFCKWKHGRIPYWFTYSDIRQVFSN